MRRAPSGRLAPLDPRLLRICPALKRHVLVLGVLLTLRGACTLAGALLLAQAVVRVVDGHSSARVLLLLAAVVLGRAGLDALADLLGSRASTRVQRDLRAAALGSMEAAGPAWLRAQEQSRAAHLLGPGLDVLDGYVTRALPALVATAVVPVVVLAGIGSQDLLSLGLLLLVLPLVPVFLVLLGLTTRDRTERSRATLALLAAKVLDLLQGLPTLKIHGRAAGQVAALGRVTELHRVQTLAALRWALVSGLVLDLLASLSVALVAVGAGLRLESGALDLGSALAVLLLAPEVFAPLRAVGTHHHASTEALGAAQEVLELVDRAAAPGPAGTRSPDVGPAAGSAPPGSVAAGSVAALVGVTVRHPGRTVDALRGVDLVLSTGEVVVVLGPSGSGKSTLLDVLAGAVPPTTGALRGGPRADVVLCPALPRPTRATVGAEVLLGDPGATGQQLLAVLAACAAPTARTPLGEAGRALSAGQRRRVVLARTLLRARAIAGRGGRPLVLLDEPSEDLDHELEQVVAEVVRSLSAIATVVLVTHSESLAEVAGRRVELRDGRVGADRARSPRHVAPLPDRRAGPDREASPAARPSRVRLRPLVAVFRHDGSGLHGRLLLAVAVGAAGAVSALGLAAASGWLVLRAAQHPGVQALAVAVVAVRAAALTRPLLRYAERLTGHDLALRVLTRTRVRVLAALVPLAPSGLEFWRRGDLLRRFSADVDAVQDVLVRGLLPVTTALTTAAVGLVAVSLLSPPSVVPLGVLLGVTALVLPLAAALSRGTGGDAAGARDERTVAWVEGYRELWGLGALADGAREIARLDDEVARTGARERRVRAGAALVSSIATGLAPVVVLAAAAGGGTSGLRVGVAALVAIATVEPLAATGPVWASTGAALHRAGRVAAVLRLPAPVPEPACPVAPPTGRLGVLLSDATTGHGSAVLTGVDLELGPGVRLAVTGPSGCGKSSLLDTVLRLLPVRAGTAALTGGAVTVDLGDLAAAAVPPLLTGCLQDDHVFATTLRENLRIGRPGADDADLDDVARRLDLLSWVRGLPDGWGTRVGEDGSRLSGGQRQRVLLARALLADAQVLVLDEPTAHLDRETEALVMRDLIRATRDRTVLLATHRHDTLVGLDGVVDLTAVIDLTGALQPV